MPRFVVLFHEMPDGSTRPSHWDLMLEDGATLRTWALESQPSSKAAVWANPLAPHRREYLTFEGPISGDRGTVTRWDAGEYQIVDETETEMMIEFDGARMPRRLLLCRDEDSQRWRFSPAGD